MFSLKFKQFSLNSFQNEIRCCMHESEAFMFYDNCKEDSNELYSYRNPERKLGFIQKQKMGLNSSQQRHYCKPYNFTIPNIIYKIKFMAYFPFLKFHCSGLKHFPMLCFMFVRGQAFHAGRLFTNPKIGLPDVRLLGF